MRGSCAYLCQGSGCGPRLIFGRAPAAVLLVLLTWQFSGCAWRTSKADRAFGPVLYRFSHPSTNSLAMETMHLPVLLEGGTQWGLSLGCAKRFTLSTISEPEEPAGFTVEPASRRWRLSLMYLRTPAEHTAVFMRRTVVGLHGGAGGEERSLTAGYSSIIATTPPESAILQLEYLSRAPLDSTFLVTPVSSESTRPSVTENAP